MMSVRATHKSLAVTTTGKMGAFAKAESRAGSGGTKLGNFPRLPVSVLVTVCAVSFLVANLATAANYESWPPNGAEKRGDFASENGNLVGQRRFSERSSEGYRASHLLQLRRHARQIRHLKGGKEQRVQIEKSADDDSGGGGGGDEGGWGDNNTGGNASWERVAALRHKQTKEEGEADEGIFEDVRVDRNERGNDEVENDFPEGYWVRIAQAKALALVVENGILPRRDEYSNIIKGADCMKEHDKDCIDFTTVCAKNKANFLQNQLKHEGHIPARKHVAQYMSSIFTECNFKKYQSPEDDALPAEEWTIVHPPPEVPYPAAHFHCNKHEGQDKVITNILMDYANETIPDLPSDLLPRYFVIEKNHGGKWELHENSVQPYWLFKFSTEPGQFFRIRVTAVSPKYVYPPVTSPLLKIYPSAKITLRKPRDFRVINISLDDSATRPSPSALLRWKSGSGENASCDWDVHCMEEDYLKVERRKGEEAFWINLSELTFERTYTVIIHEKLGGGKVEDLTSYVNIPSCLEMRKYNLSMCLPPMPTKIRIASQTDYSFWVAWNPPKYSNDNNHILHYNLTVEWVFTPTPMAFSREDGHRHSASFPFVVNTQISTHRVFSGTIPGNVTTKEITNLGRMKGQFKVTVIAVGLAGPSEPAADMVTFEGPEVADWTVHKILVPVIALGGVVAFIGLLCCLKHFYDRRQRDRRRQEKFESYERDCLPLEPFAEKDALKWEIDSCNLDLREPVGQGNFGLVRRAILNTKGRKMIVAVKTLRDGGDTKDVDKLWEEYEILRNLDPHVHVVGLKGIVTKHVPSPLLVVEYCEGGNLQAFLRKMCQSAGFTSNRKFSPADSALSSGGGSTNSIATMVHSSASSQAARVVTNAAYFLRDVSDNREPCIPLTIADLLSYSRQVAIGMEYLSSNKIVHRDLAARNILIAGKSRILKIADFGLSRDVYEQSWYKKNSKGDIPIKWLAKESILNEIYTTKSDVWSYGILLWEIFTYGGNPYPGVDNMTVFQLIKEGYRMPCPDASPEPLYKLMRLCWDDEPNARPDFGEIRHMLEEIIEKVTHVTYLNLEHVPKCDAIARYKNCDSGFDEFEDFNVSGSEPALPPRNKLRLEQ